MGLLLQTIYRNRPHCTIIDIAFHKFGQSSYSSLISVESYVSFTSRKVDSLCHSPIMVKYINYKPFYFTSNAIQLVFYFLDVFASWEAYTLRPYVISPCVDQVYFNCWEPSSNVYSDVSQKLCIMMASVIQPESAAIWRGCPKTFCSTACSRR